MSYPQGPQGPQGQWGPQQPQQPPQWNQPIARAPSNSGSSAGVVFAVLGALVVLGIGGALAWNGHQAREEARGYAAQQAVYAAQQAMLAAQQPRTMVLPHHVTGCRFENTGFLGLGIMRRARATIHNDGPVAGTFTMRVTASYPGGGQLEHLRVAVSVPANGAAEATGEFQARDGVLGANCLVDAPTVVMP